MMNSNEETSVEEVGEIEERKSRVKKERRRGIYRISSLFHWGMMRLHRVLLCA